jgi:hypothetical protein
LAIECRYFLRLRQTGKISPRIRPVKTFRGKQPRLTTPGPSFTSNPGSITYNHSHKEKVFIGIKPYLLYNNQLYFQAEKEGDEKPYTKG